jgi:hypothetical protein
MTIKVTLSNDEAPGGKCAQYVLGDNPPIKLPPGNHIALHIHHGWGLTVSEAPEQDLDGDGEIDDD